MSLETTSSNPSLSIEAQERIAEELIRFSRALKNGENPSIEDYLEGFEGAERSEFLRELILCEHAHSQEDELITFESYRERFPEDVEVVDQAEKVFREGQTIIEGNTPLPVPPQRLQYIGEYKLLEEIAHGGMGVVYKARHQNLKCNLALKMILAGHLATAEDIARFQNEARMAARLKHPNIVPVHEVGEFEGHHYFTMDLIEGRSLAEEIREETLSPRQAAQLVQAIAQAVHYAHEKNVLHRDLKPANIILDARDQPHITDFGLAKITERDDDDSMSELTGTNQILGTASYMSPEQASGKHNLVGPASDIYSLGAVLYACLTGRGPHLGESTYDTLQQVINQEPLSPRVVNTAVPKDLETICLKCLTKEPHKRYGTAEELAEDLGRFLEGRPVVARPVGLVTKTVRWCQRNTAVAVLLVLVAFSLLSGTSVSTFFAIEANDRAVAESKAKDRAEGFLNEVRQGLERERGLRKESEETRKDAERAKDDADTARRAAEADKKRAEIAKLQAIAERKKTEAEKKRAQWEAYVARLQPMRQAWLEKEFGHLDRLLQESIPKEGEPDFRGWEWYYFQDQVNAASEQIGDHREFTGFFSHDPIHNRILAARDNDHWEMWDLKTNQLIDTLVLRDCRPETVHISPDGKKVAWGTWNARLRVLDMDRQTMLHDIDAHPTPRNWMGDVAWSPSGGQIASASRAGGIKIWIPFLVNILGRSKTHLKRMIHLDYVGIKMRG